VNHGTYRSGHWVSGTLTTALYLGEIRTGTNTGQAGGWTDGRTVGQLGTGGKGWEQGGKNNKRKNNNLAGINYIPRGRTEHLTTTKVLD